MTLTCRKKPFYPSTDFLNWTLLGLTGKSIFFEKLVFEADNGIVSGLYFSFTDKVIFPQSPV